jgi:hypothetical protein
MSASTTAVVVASLLTVSSRLGAQTAPVDTVERLTAVVAEVQRIGRTAGDGIWPGFRPDTIPLSFVHPERGDWLLGWRGALPEGYVPVAGHPTIGWRARRELGAASTGTELAGRRVAQVVLSSLDGAALASTAVHEAFHVFEAASRREGRRFGQSENAFYVSSYPIFDVDNERDVALEGRLLAAALDARVPADRRALAQAFAAVRRERHRRIAPEIALFDQQSEMNEGLAEYALARALLDIEGHGPDAWRASATRHLAEQRRRLDALTTDATQSLRLRYYATGPAIGRLLDALGGPGWQLRMLAENWTLQDALADATGLDAAATRARAFAATRVDTARLRADAVETIERLAAARRRQVDSVLARPGLRLVLLADSLPGRDVGVCSFDPQNHLQISPTMQLQTRFWRPCAGKAMTSELTVPSVHDARAGTVTAVVGGEGEVALSASGAPLVVHDGERRVVTAFALDAPRATVKVARAEVMRRGDTLTVRVLP